jgi:hypothetical protein
MCTAGSQTGEWQSALLASRCGPEMMGAGPYRSRPDHRVPKQTNRVVVGSWLRPYSGTYSVSRPTTNEPPNKPPNKQASKQTNKQTNKEDFTICIDPQPTTRCFRPRSLNDQSITYNQSPITNHQPGCFRLRSLNDQSITYNQSPITNHQPGCFRLRSLND